MKADELGRALTDLAGDDPPIDAALQRVRTRARNARIRTRLGIAALSSLIIAGVVTEVCVAFPALSALAEGFDVFVG